MTIETLHVGDTLRFSVELLKEMIKEPDYRSVIVRVVDIRTEADGSKLLVLDRVLDRTETPGKP